MIRSKNQIWKQQQILLDQDQNTFFSGSKDWNVSCADSIWLSSPENCWKHTRAKQVHGRRSSAGSFKRPERWVMSWPQESRNLAKLGPTWTHDGEKTSCMKMSWCFGKVGRVLLRALSWDKDIQHKTILGQSNKTRLCSINIHHCLHYSKNPVSTPSDIEPNLTTGTQFSHAYFAKKIHEHILKLIPVFFPLVNDQPQPLIFASPVFKSAAWGTPGKFRSR